MDDHKLQIILAARDATKSAFMSASGQVKAFTKNIFSLKGAMVGIAGATGMGLFVKKSMETADAIGKASDVIGISTDALQEYRHAARLAGVSTELMDNSFKAFSKRVGEARNETGALVTFLKKFDEQLLKDIQTAGSTEEALDLVMDRMGRTASQTDRAALAAAAFSRSGLVLTNMVKDGAAGLAKMRQEARDLGIVMDERLIRESERANDELEKLTRVLKVQFMSAAVGLAPEIANLAQYTTDWWKANQGMVKTDIAGWAKKTKDAILDIKGIYDELPEGVVGATGVGLIVAIIGRSGPLGALAAALMLTSSKIKQFRRDHPEIFGGEGPIFRGHGATESWQEPPKPALMQEFTKTISKISPYPELLELKNIKPFGDFPKFETEETKNAFEDMYSDLRFKSDDYYEYQKTQLQKQAQDYAQYTGDVDLAHQWLMDQIKALDEERLQASNQTNKYLIDLSQRTAEAIEDNFSSFFKDAFRGELDGAKSYFKAFCDSLLDSFADMLGQMAKESLFGSKTLGTSGMLSGLWGWVKGLFGGSSISSGVSYVKHGAVFSPGRIHPFAHGDIVNRPTLFPFAGGVGLMGEAGAEAVMPLTRTSSGDLGVRAQGTGGRITNINIYCWDSQSMEQFVRRHKNIFVGINIENIERNGSLRQAIGATI